MANPDVLINGDYLNEIDVKSEYLNIKRKVLHVDINKQLEILDEYYKKSFKAIKYNQNRSIELNKEAEKGKYYLSTDYPSLSEFIVKYGEKLLNTKYEAFGKGYMPYVIWAACNDQFNNSILKDILVIEVDKFNVKFTSENIFEELKEYYSSELERLNIEYGSNLISSYKSLIKLLERKEDPKDGLIKEVELYLDSQPTSIKHIFKKTTFSLVYNTYYNTDINFNNDGTYKYVKSFFKYVNNKETS